MVGIVTNISSDHLGLGGINTLEELARVKQVVIESVASDGAAVLNAEDPLVAEMAAATDAEVVYFSTDPNNHIIQAHMAEGGRCVFIDDGYIVLMRDGQRNDLVELERVEFTAGGQIAFQVQNALAATAAAWAAGMNPAMIARALTTFKTDIGMVPGRFNISELNGVQVVLDYGHNQAAVRAMMQGVKALGERNTVMVIGLPGDRRDSDITATFDETLPYVNRYVLHDLKDRREREKDAVPHLMAGRIPTDIPYDIVDDQREAVFKAWNYVKPGDRIVIVADIVDETYESLQSLAEAKGDSSCESPLSSEQQEPRDGHNGWRIQAE
jgi:cyanophycin synthetase